MKNLKKALAVILSIVILIQIMPMGAWAASEKAQIKRMLNSMTPLPAGEDAFSLLTEDLAAAMDTDAPGKESEVSPIDGEVVDMRDENTKHYRHINGSYTAAMHGGPIHFMDNAGEWQDIDNTLSLDSGRQSAAGRATYVPAASGLDIRIPQDFADDQKLTISKDGYTVGMGIKAQGDAVDVLLKEKNAVAEEKSLEPELEAKTPGEDAALPEGQPTLESGDEAATQPAEEPITNLEGPPVLESNSEAVTAATTASTTVLEGPHAPEDGEEITTTADKFVTEPETATESETQPAPEKPAARRNVIDLSKIKAEINNDLAAEEVIDEPTDQTVAEKVKAENAKKMKLDNLSSAVIYRDIFPGTDLEWIVMPGEIKENLYIKELQDEYTYLFDLSLDGLIPVPQEDGSIYLYVDIEGEEPLFILEAPYMFDAEGEESTALSMTLAEDGTLTLVADAAWINDETRVLPVVIDPTLYIVSTVSFTDSNVCTANLDKNYQGTDYRNYAGKGRTGTLLQTYSARTYMKFALPGLPAGSIITNAALKVEQNKCNPFTAGNYLVLFDLTGKASLNTNTVTWNNQPVSKALNGPRNGGLAMLGYAPLENGARTHYFDITTAARNWFENNNNNGVMLTTFEENANVQSYIWSTRHPTVSNRPALFVEYYANLIGLEDYWQYETLGLGRSGTAYVNDYNGSLTYVHSDLAMNGNRLPIAIGHVYNSNGNDIYGTKYSGMNVGMKFHLNLQELLIPIGSSDPLYGEGYRYKHYDGDGTLHYFREHKVGSVTKITHEFDTNLVVTQNGSNFIITDGQDNKKYFNSAGQLFKIEDNNGNIQTFTFSGNQITQVTDPAGRVATLAYNGSDQLVSITDPAGRATAYAYNPAGQLETITYPDGKTTAFLYQSNNLSKITADDGSALAFQFGATAYSNDRVSKVTQFDKAGEEVTYLQFSYTNTTASNYVTGHTVVSDSLGNSNTYLFDEAGRMSSVTNQHGQTQYLMYHTLPPDPTTADRNAYQRVQSTSELQTISTNLLKNHGFEQNGSAWAMTPGSGTVQFSSDESKRGSRSLLLQTADANTLCSAGQLFGGAANQTYTLSADVYIPETLQGSGGAKLGFSWQNSLGSAFLEASGGITSTSGWERVSYTFTLPSNAASSLRAMLILDSAEGSVYVDNIQLEKSGGSRQYNLVENSDFSDAPGATTGPTGTWPVSWALTNVDPTDGVQVVDGRNCVWMGGSPLKEKKVSQSVPVNAQAGETLIIGGKAAAYASGFQGDFGIVATIYSDETTEEETFWIPFDVRIAHEYQVTALAHTLETDCHHIVYSFVYANQTGYVSFDDAFVYVGNYGTNYEYDDRGRLQAAGNDIGDSIVITYNAKNDAKKIEQIQCGIPTNTIELDHDNNHNVISTTDQTGVETTYTYDIHGQTTSQTITKDSLETTETMTYTPDGNYPATCTDARGGVTSYTYDLTKGLLLSATDPNGNTVSYSYDPLTDELLSTTGNADTSTPVSTGITTQDHMLDTITRNGMEYSYEYDAQNRVTAAKVGNQTLVSNTYDSRQRLEQQIFANGAVYAPMYDSRDRLVGDSWDNTQISEYYYNENDRLSQVVDLSTGVTTQFGYSFDGLLDSILGSDGTQTKLGYDIKGQLSSLTFSKNGATIHDAWYSSDNQGRPAKASLFSLGGASLAYDYDEVGRLTARTLETPNTAIYSPVTYLEGHNGNVTDLVEQFKNEDLNAGVLQQYDYEYDAKGNITRITDLDNNITQYTYDGLNRLTVESDGAAILKYSYDAGGNLTSVTKNNSPLDSYTYSNANWKDQLTAFNGNTITYDALGNPLTYGGMAFSWQRGRQLAGITGNGQNIQYAYDAAGRRVSKTVGGVTTNYTYSGDLLMRQSDGTDTLEFQYDGTGKAVGFMHNGVPYYYLRNLQNDVVAIMDAEGTVVAEYEYDAWGNQTEKPAVRTYTIAYAANGGSGIMANTSASYWNTVALRGNTFVAGYLFEGWTAHRASDDTYFYENSSTGTEDWYPENQQPSGYDLKIFANKATVSALSPVNGDTVTMYAQWSQTEIAYTIAYAANGGSGNMASTSATYITPAALPANIFTPVTGYQFDGWTAQRASDNKYLYENGSTEIWCLKNSQPLGYVLKVLADQATVSALSPVDGDTITMTAQWSKANLSYTITYNANGGSGSMANTSAFYWTSVALHPNAFIYGSFHMAGWTAHRASDNKYLYKNGSAEEWYPQNHQPLGYALKVFADQATVSALSPVNGDTITMYAQWSQTNISYYIAYNANGGSGSMASAYASYWTSVALDTNTFTRNNYLFGGWTAKRAYDSKYLYSHGTGAEDWYPQGQQPSGSALKVFADQASVSELSPLNGDTVTMYAQWIPDDIYFIVYDANGGYGTMPKTTAAFIDAVSLRSNKFIYAGYLMAGWTAYRASDDTYLYIDSLTETEDWYPEGQEPSGYDLKVFANKAMVSALSEVSGDTITMRAEWDVDEFYVPIDPCGFEEELLLYFLSKTRVPANDHEPLANEILGMDILSLDLLRQVCDDDGLDATETENLIDCLLTNYSTDELLAFVRPILYDSDYSDLLGEDEVLGVWADYLWALIEEIVTCFVEVMELDAENLAPTDAYMLICAVEQIAKCYVYLIRAEQNVLAGLIRPRPEEVPEERLQEVELLYAALEALLAGEESELELFGEGSIFSGFDKNDILTIFDELLLFVLSLEVPDLDNLLALCEGWGYTQQETEDTVMLIVAAIAAEPILAALIVADETMGGDLAGRYGDGPMQSAGGCFDSQTENQLTLASANYYPMAVAIREEAVSLLGLDLQDEDDAFLGALVSAIFLYCYFADYLEQINLWRAAKGEDPIDFGGSAPSQTSAITQQMSDLLAEQADNGNVLAKMAISGSAQKQQLGFFDNITRLFSRDSAGQSGGALNRFGQLSKLFSGGDDGEGPLRGGAFGPDIGELNPIRYRGYYWDEETGYYFLQTRYYSSEWRRFLNADSLFVAGEDMLNGSNMYAYCNGNPVMYADPSGMGIICDFFSSLCGRIGSFFEGIFGRIQDFFQGLFENGLSGLIDSAWEFFVNIPHMLTQIGTLLGPIGGGLSLLGRGLEAFLKFFDFCTEAGKFFTGLGNKIFGGWSRPSEDSPLYGLWGGISATLDVASFITQVSSSIFVPIGHLMVEGINFFADLFTGMGGGGYGSDPITVIIEGEGEMLTSFEESEEQSGPQAIESGRQRVKQVYIYYNHSNYLYKQANLHAVFPDNPEYSDSTKFTYKWTKKDDVGKLDFPTNAKTKSVLVRAFSTTDPYAGLVTVEVFDKATGSRVAYETVYVVAVKQIDAFLAVAKYKDTYAFARPLSNYTEDRILLNITEAQPYIANLDVRGEITVGGKDFYYVAVRKKKNAYTSEGHFRFVEKQYSKAASNATAVEKQNISKVYWPTENTQPSYFFGHRSGSFHSGVDIGTGGLTEYNINNYDIPVYAIMDGTVYSAKRNQGARGHVVILEHNIAGFGTFYTLYQHLRDKNNDYGELPTEGTWYKAGDRIAYIGASGTFADPPRSAHLHFEMMRTLPPGLPTGSYYTMEPVNPLIMYHYAHDTRDPRYVTKIWNPNPFFTLSGNIRSTSAVYTFLSVNPYFNWHELKDGSWPDKYSRDTTHKR